MNILLRRSHASSGIQEGPAREVSLRTLIALFDDIIDAEHALMTLRKSDQHSEGISVILRERVLDPDPNVRYETVLSRVVASSALEAVSNWLQGLASLILPDRASYLVAGPIGAVLATIKDASVSVLPQEEPDSTSDTSRQLSRALSAFGFRSDEADYVEARVVAGSPLIAVTSDRASMLREANKTFSQYDAVHVGLARTDTTIQRTAARLLLTGPDGGGSVVIADAIAPLRRLSVDGGWRNHSIDLRGRVAVDQAGAHLGTVSDVLFEIRPTTEDDVLSQSAADRRSVIIRYVLVDFGGLLGFKSQRVAVPAELADTTGWSIALETTRAELRSAPRFDSLSPLSRRDEITIRSHYGVDHYWLNTGDADSGDEQTRNRAR